MTMDQCIEPRIADLTDKDYKRSVIILAMLVLAALMLKALLLSRFPIHDDEFYYLSKVYQYERGELATAFQSFHVHFFGWLSAAGQNEVAQVMAARIVMYFFLLGTCFYLFRLARYFLGVRGALFCVLCYLCFISTIVNGASFRSDTPATFFIMFALYHFIVRENSVFSNFLAGAATAVSLLFTIKAAIFLPLFAGWFLSRWLFCAGRSKSLIRNAFFPGSLIIVFIILYKLHASTIYHSATVEKENVNFLSHSFSTFVTLKQIFPARRWIILTLTIDFLVWFLLFSGFLVHLTELLQRRFTRNEPKAFLSILATPILSLLLYRNAYPYFFVFLIPTSTVFCGYLFEFLASKGTKRITATLISIVLGLMVLSNFLVRFPRYVTYDAEQANLQRNVLTAIHKMFPRPVPYVDTCSMVSSYPKVGLFMSPAYIRNYQKRVRPIMDSVLREKKPIFLLVNYDFLLDLNLSQPPQPFNGKGLFDADWAALKSYFIHHWGPIWVVGKQFKLGQLKELQKFEIIVPGLYTVESDANILIDNTFYCNGDVIHLDAGTHAAKANRANTTVKLRWGDHLYKPNREPKMMHLGASHY